MAESGDKPNTHSLRYVCKVALEIIVVYVILWILIFFTTYPPDLNRGFGEELYPSRIAFFACVILVFIEAIKLIVKRINYKKTKSPKQYWQTLGPILEVFGVYIISWLLTSYVFWTAGKLSAHYIQDKSVLWEMTLLSLALAITSEAIINVCRKNRNNKHK